MNPGPQSSPNFRLTKIAFRGHKMPKCVKRGFCDKMLTRGRLLRMSFMTSCVLVITLVVSDNPCQFGLNMIQVSIIFSVSMATENIPQSKAQRVTAYCVNVSNLLERRECNYICSKIMEAMNEDCFTSHTLCLVLRQIQM